MDQGQIILFLCSADEETEAGREKESETDGLYWKRSRLLTPIPCYTPKSLQPPISAKFLKGDLETSQTSIHGVLCPKRSRKPSKGLEGTFVQMTTFESGIQHPFPRVH